MSASSDLQAAITAMLTPEALKTALVEVLARRPKETESAIAAGLLFAPLA